MHTVITTKETYVAVLSTKSYELCFQKICEQYKNKKNSSILMSRLLIGLDLKLFRISYFSLFFHEVVKKNTKILIQDHPNDYIYLINSGDFEVSMNKSIMDINFIIKYFGLIPIKEKLSDKECM